MFMYICYFHILTLKRFTYGRTPHLRLYYGFTGVKNIISIDKQLINIRMSQTVLMSSRVHYKTNIIPIALYYIGLNDKKVKEKFLFII